MKKELIRKPTGTNDLLPDECFKRRHIENILVNFFSCYNYKEIRTPTFEKTELFKRGIGDYTDVVSKEMYSFHNNEFTLKPEMTAPVIRAYLENNLDNLPGVVKLFYIANMYRHERPQAGRFREFSQFGAEAIGSDSFLIDAEMISLAVKILQKFGIKNIKTKINTIGTPEERKEFLQELKKYLLKHFDSLTEISKTRLEKNPLRILDTKEKHEIEILKSAPKLYDYLNKKTKQHFENLLSALSNINIQYEIDYNLVRGFDYYTSTTFEIVSEELGSQNAVIGGGRYDNLIEELGGKPTPAIGFACGIERFMVLIEKSNYNYPIEKPISIYFVTYGEKAKEYTLRTIIKLRDRNLMCDTDFLNRSIKAQMKEANKINAEYTIVIGEDELNTNKATIKRMKDGKEFVIDLNQLEYINIEDYK
ncbi:MAG: histidine--tRNA ligase [Ignavibacteria bacterium]|nr:histidine--tRNA ligase [Ignavibacteria bacterium]